MMNAWAFLLLALVAVVSTQDAFNLVKEMTTEEKYSIVEGIGWVGVNPITDPHYYYVGNTPPVERLGIPPYNMQDGPQGFRTYEPTQVDEVTAWPSSLCIAASFDPQLVHKWATAMAHEFKTKGANMILGPCLDIGRVPRAGRAAESLSGEDPILGSRMGVAYIHGVQSQKLMGCAKHFTVYNQETIRDYYDAKVSNQALFDLYYRPIRAAIDEGDVASVMCSYNLVNGVHACQNPSTLKRDLKLRMNFDGFVMSDWYACHDSDAAENGLDMEQPGDVDPNGEGPFFSPEILAEKVSNQTLNDMSWRILNAMIKVGAFNDTVCAPPNCDNLYINKNATTPQHQELAAKIVAESTVLLKNERNVLPLHNMARKIAIVGSACDSPFPTTVNQNLDWTNGTYYWIGGSGRVMSTRVKSFVTAMKEKFPPHVLSIDLSDDINSSLEAMKGAEVAFTCGGATSSESFDRDSLSLNEEAFITELAEKKGMTPLVGIMMTAGSTATPFADNLDGLLSLFFGGEGTGAGLVKVVTGEVNPSARLPLTYLNARGIKNMIQPCVDANVDCKYDEGINVGYVGLSSDEIAFPFGHGLSYSHFDYQQDPMNPCHPGNGELACFNIQVNNAGPMDGAEVVQAYLQYPGDSERVFMKDFKKVFLKAHEHETVRIAITKQSTEMWLDADHGEGFYVPEGTYTVHIGPDSQTVYAQGKFTI